MKGINSVKRSINNMEDQINNLNNKIAEEYKYLDAINIYTNILKSSSLDDLRNKSKDVEFKPTSLRGYLMIKYELKRNVDIPDWADSSDVDAVDNDIDAYDQLETDAPTVALAMTLSEYNSYFAVALTNND